MSTETLALIPLLPLVAAAITSGMQCGRRSAGIAVAAMLGSCVLALMACNESWGMAATDHKTFDIEWLTVGTTAINFGFVLDPLTGVMVAMVTFVGLLIFIFSFGYMKDDPRMARFFCYLSLFAAGMLGLILANSLLLLFMCWEIVGVASYLLISFWNHKPEAAAAGKKAFIVTRIGDMGFLIGILLAFKTTGTLMLYDGGAGLLETEMAGTVFGFKTAAVVSLLLFCGAAGKSGQLPLHVWLPDAMEGPTPVSALIHAATMVAAGVFLVARAMPLFVGGRHAVGGGLGGGSHRARSGLHCVGAIRHQTNSCVLHRQPARPNDGGPRRRRRGNWDVSFADARVFQGAALSWCGQHHPWLPRGTGHP